LGGIFAFEALCPILVLPAMLISFWKTPASDDNPIGGSLFMLAFFASVACIFGVASWTVSAGKRWARGWGIAASVLNILVALPSLYFRPAPGLLLAVAIGMGAAGITGIVVFSIPSKLAVPAIGGAAYQSTPGDGTNAVLNRLVWLLGTILGVAGVRWWTHWSQVQMLPEQPGWMQMLWIVPVLAVTTVVHELGHAIAARTVGMKISSFVLGPLAWRITDGRWKFKFSTSGPASVGGAVGVASTRADEPRWYRVWILTAGPLANLILGLIMFSLAMTAKDSSYEGFWGVLADLATINLGIFAINLIPLRVGGFYSDGANIYQMLSGGYWADHHRVNAIVSSVKVTDLRPRDYDLAAVARLAKNAPTAYHEMYCWLYTYEYHLDRGEIAHAREALEKAELTARQSEESLTYQQCMIFVFSIAYLRRDADATRAWWQRMESMTPTEFQSEYWLAHCALHWVEGDLGTANESWNKGNAMAQLGPSAGAYEFDRYWFMLMREAIDQTAAGSLVSVHRVPSESIERHNEVHYITS
jgi:Zn-dependent protease